MTDILPFASLVLYSNLPSFTTMLWTALIIVVVSALALALYDRLYRKMEKREMGFVHAANNRLSLILKVDNTRVWTYDVATRRYQRMNEDGAFDSTEFTPIDFSRFFDRDDFEELRNEIFAIRDGKKESVTLQMRGPATAAGIKQQRFEVKVSVQHRDEDGNPTTIIGSQRDITDEKQQREREREELISYQTVFNSSLVDMAYYDEDGILTDINERSAASFRIKDKQALIDSGQHISEMTGFDDIDFNTVNTIHCTTMMDMEQLEEEGRKGEGVELEGKMYYETMLYPVRDEQGELLGIFLEGRDITEMVETFKLQEQSMKELMETTMQVKDYIENINLALQMAECRIMNYLPDSHTLQITSDLNKPQHNLSQIRAIDCIDESQRKAARRLLHQMDHRSLKNVDARLKTIFPEQDGQNTWLYFNGIPMHDEEGHITHYFGLSRNDTKLVQTEMKLRSETLKALEAEKLKNTFLLNMSYEIRTPLTSVLGFAELFEKQHDEKDEQVFVNEIKMSSNTLLTLVNDILYLSRIDAHMIEPKLAPADFAFSFVAHCHIGWSSNTKPEIKTIVEDPYEHLEVIIDEELLGKVIEILTGNAIYYTSEGMVRAKYEYRLGALNITIEDTGIGIAPDVLPHIFERFNRDQNEKQCGTGLVLPILKGLVELMGGTIDFMSELGKGTTVWVSIPCELVKK